MKIKGKCWVANTYVMAYDIIVQRFWDFCDRSD